MKSKFLLYLSTLLLAVSSVHASRSKDQQLGQRVENVRTTAYTYGAAENGAYPSSNAIGKPLKAGKVRSAAADWSRWPLAPVSASSKAARNTWSTTSVAPWSAPAPSISLSPAPAK